MALEYIPVSTTADNVSAREFSDAQQRLKRLFNTLGEAPFLDGNFIEDEVLTAVTPKNIQHKLQRAYRGFMVLGCNAAATIHEAASNPDDAVYIRLESSATATVSIWVF